MTSATAGSGGGGANKMASLRAMFEKKDDVLPENSPPDQRGRCSEAVSAASSRNGISPRPLSKVRTSFIAVGGAAGLGLVRSESTHSDNSVKRSALSMDVEKSSKETAVHAKDSPNLEPDARRKIAPVVKPIPEAAVEISVPATDTVDKQSKAKANGKPVNGKPGPEKISPVAKSAANKMGIEGRTLKPAEVPLPTDKSTNGTAAKSPSSSGPAQAKNTSRTTTKPAAQVASLPARAKAVPAAISTKTLAPAKASPKPAKSPLLPKTPTTPKAAAEPKKVPVKSSAPAAKRSVKTPEPKPSRQLLASPASHKSPAPSKTSNHGSPNAFVKPKPKAPTKPIQLPPSLTAPTASSRSKTSDATAPPPIKRARSQSRPAAPPATGLGGLRRAQSVVKRSAIGPPPAKKDVSKPNGATAPAAVSNASSVAPSEGFMARMMRPTASSQSKTSDKTNPTPPKKAQPAKRPTRHSGSRPSTRDSTSVQKAFVEGGTGKASKTTPSQGRVMKGQGGPTAEAVAAIPKMKDIPAAAALEPVAVETVTLPILASVENTAEVGGDETRGAEEMGGKLDAAFTPEAEVEGAVAAAASEPVEQEVEDGASPGVGATGQDTTSEAVEGGEGASEERGSGAVAGEEETGAEEVKVEGAAADVGETF